MKTYLKTLAIFFLASLIFVILGCPSGIESSSISKVRKCSSTYDSSASTITLTWTDPSDEDFDRVLISYITNDGNSDSEESDSVSIAKGTQTYTLTSVNVSVQYYKFYLKTVDVSGNTSANVIKKCNILSTIPEDFVEVKNTTFDGTTILSPESSVFINKRSITIDKLYVCDHEVTQAEYETYCKYGSSEPNSTYGDGDDYPVYNVNYYDAIIYCNLRSIAEGLTPVYSISSQTDPSKWTGIVSSSIDGLTKYCGPSERNTTWDEKVTFSSTANGYRLPTEAEWEYIARGGSEWKNYKYSGSDVISDVAWFYVNSSSSLHEAKQKTENSLEIYDMSGNVWEWCYDFYGNISKDIKATGPVYNEKNGIINHVLRGGCFLSDASNCTISYRNERSPAARFVNCGFRIVRNAN